MLPFTFFVSYRRQDTAPIALLLKNEIEKRLQFVRVSVDVEEMVHGDHFPEHLKRLIDNAHATIALIGKQWMPSRDTGSTAARIGDDWVAHELEYSESTPLAHPEEDRYKLTRRKILPLFVDCKPSFDQFQLPPSIAYLSQLHAERIDYASWPRDIGSLLDRLAVSLDLKKRPDKDRYPEPSPVKARTQPVADKELAATLAYDDYEGWYLDNFGDADVCYLVKTFKFPHFNQAADFMAMVANYCRVLGHHPEWRNVFDSVTVALTTWDAKRKVTIYDLNLALYMNKAARAISKIE